jgi:hypothetical protein
MPLEVDISKKMRAKSIKRIKNVTDISKNAKSILPQGAIVPPTPPTHSIDQFTA